MHLNFYHRRTALKSFKLRSRFASGNKVLQQQAADGCDLIPFRHLAAVHSSRFFIRVISSFESFLHSSHFLIPIISSFESFLHSSRVQTNEELRRTNVMPLLFRSQFLSF